MTERMESIPGWPASPYRAMVYGVEAQGSKRLVTGKNGKTLMLEASPRTKPWRQGLSEAMQAVGVGKITGAVAVRLLIFVERPRSHYGTGRNAGRLKPNAPRYAACGKDADKVQRAVGDAGKGLWWADDRQIAHWWVLRVYTEGKERVEVTAWPLDLRRAGA